MTIYTSKKNQLKNIIHYIQISQTQTIFKFIPFSIFLFLFIIYNFFILNIILFYFLILKFLHNLLNKPKINIKTIKISQHILLTTPKISTIKKKQFQSHLQKLILHKQKILIKHPTKPKSISIHNISIK